MDVDYLVVRELPLYHDWPGWWSKMELFRPDLHEDILYLDLDTTIVDDIEPLIAKCRNLPIALNDFFHPPRLASGFMYLPANFREEIWKKWIEKPDWYMHHTRKGDQGFLEQSWGDIAWRWQSLCPGKVVSYKVDVRPTGKVPEEAAVVCFHGQPRPWAVPELRKP